MPRREMADEENLKSFNYWGKLLISIEEIRRRMKAGEVLYIERSLLSDHGPDCTALYLGNEKVGYWSGY